MFWTCGPKAKFSCEKNFLTKQKLFGPLQNCSPDPTTNSETMNPEFSEIPNIQFFLLFFNSEYVVSELVVDPVILEK